MGIVPDSVLLLSRLSLQRNTWISHQYNPNNHNGHSSEEFLGTMSSTQVYAHKYATYDQIEPSL